MNTLDYLLGIYKSLFFSIVILSLFCTIYPYIAFRHFFVELLDIMLLDE